MTSSTPTQADGSAQSVIAQLRGLMPRRPLGFWEARMVAELQANRLLALAGHRAGQVSDALIAELPRINIQYRHDMMGSGLTTWERGAWRIAINADEPRARQRFTLAHELKHVIDASHEDRIYRHLPIGPARQRHIEAICDHFAACLLMPRSQVKRLWGQGIQDLGGLSCYFDVSQQAVLIRLQVLGLVEPLPRCIRTVVGVGRVAVGDGRDDLRSRHRATIARMEEPVGVQLYRRDNALAARYPMVPVAA